MKNFKSRVAEGKNFQLRYVPGTGFEVYGSALADRLCVARSDDDLRGILAEEPINGSEFKKLAAQRKVSRSKAEQFLKEWPHKRPGSKPNETLYFLPMPA
jgi:hypothetical protein